MDINLLWDCIRKCIDTVDWFVLNSKINGWRKSKFWRRELKNLFRATLQVNSKGGQNKDIRLKEVANPYLVLSKKMSDKVEETISDIDKNQSDSLECYAKLLELYDYHKLLKKHIDLVERRIMRGDTIKHSEKLFSIFEQHTEWINKGKHGGKKIELGHRVLIATDQYHNIVYYTVVENKQDVELTIETVDKLIVKYPDYIQSISFDKGFSKKGFKELIQLYIPEVYLPKKGRKNKSETDEENTKKFKKYMNEHSAIESNINQLENNGLDKCRDKGFKAFKRYTSIGVLSYNLHRLGNRLMQELKNQKKIRA